MYFPDDRIHVMLRGQISDGEKSLPGAALHPSPSRKCDALKSRSEVTVYASKDEEEYRSVLSALKASSIPCRPWSTEELPLFGHTILDPRKLGRKEPGLRRIYQNKKKKSHVMLANIAVRKAVERVHPGTSLTRRPPLDDI